jgi:hypothetical protein
MFFDTYIKMYVLKNIHVICMCFHTYILYVPLYALKINT